MNRRGALSFGWALALLLGLPFSSVKAADTVVYYHTDALHSVAVVTNEQGQVIERTRYAPYGAVLGRPMRDGPGYTGHQEDATTGLVYMQQRYYDPQAGRFLSVDPVLPTANGANFNRYWYANDNPYRYTDPDGRCTGTHICNGDFAASTGGYTTGSSGAAQGMRRQQALAGALSKYSSVINYGNINVNSNVHEAERLGEHANVAGFIKRVKPRGPWDFKNLDVFKNFQNRDLLQEFGNFHFGLVAHAFGFTEGASVMGAGIVQSLWQGHSIGRRLSGASNFLASAALMMSVNLPAYLASDRAAEFEARIGVRFGDYPEDTAAIIDGYDYYGTHYDR